ncbi:unnamed protein product [Allacma fusca]|uniref:3CxxC-type domain-containing protein n=1 Tax=Allacma fusca TaxID=39272 RepID=A0A8J2J3Z9_9HEXA|nr:unnamed protein product [Allacma fusca]
MTRRKKKSLYEGYNITVNANILSDNCPRVFFRVFIFKCSCKEENLNYWESPLKDAEKGELCENPKCMGNPPVVGVELTSVGTTPVQEEGRKVFGHFKCHKCSRFWCSAHSWANSSQKCRNCNIDVFPFIQQPLGWGRSGKGGQVVNINVAHNSQLCQKCQAIKGNCARLSGNKSQRRFRGGRRKKPHNVNSPTHKYPIHYVDPCVDVLYEYRIP